MLCQFLQQSRVNQLYIHNIPSFVDSLSMQVIQSTEQSSLRCTLGPYQLSILYIVMCICQSQSPNLSPSYPPITLSLFSTSVTISVLQIGSYVSLLDSTYKRYHMIFVLLWLTYFTQYDNLQIHPYCCKWHYLILFMAE